MPSAKFARVFAILALACAWRASNSRFFAFSSPDLLRAETLVREVRRRLYSHLRLPRHTFVHGDWIVRLRKPVVHIIEQIDACGPA